MIFLEHSVFQRYDPSALLSLKQTKVERRLLNILNNAPEWLSGKLSVGERRQVVRMMRPFLGQPEATVKRVVQRFLAGGGSKGYNREGTAIVLNRLYFAVPDKATNREAGNWNVYYGGNAPGYPNLAFDKDLALWPLSRIGGRLVLSGEWTARGPLPYFFEREFEALRKFGHRSRL